MIARVTRNWLVIVSLVMFVVGGVAYATSGWMNQSAKAFAGISADYSTKTQSLQMATSSTVYTLPQRNDPYKICAYTSPVFISCVVSGTPSVAISAGGFSGMIPSNSCKGPERLNYTKCAYIGLNTTGYLTFEHIPSNP